MEPGGGGPQDADARACPWVFVYGSVMHPRSLLGTLSPRADLPAVKVAQLDGWRRAWNCLSSRTFVRSDTGERVRRVVLGLERAPGASCRGVLWQVDALDMAKLRKRESAYDEVDVSSDIDVPLGRTTTFVPSRAHRRDHWIGHESLVVEREYFESCVEGAEHWGLPAVASELAAQLDLELVSRGHDVLIRPPRPTSGAGDA